MTKNKLKAIQCVDIFQAFKNIIFCVEIKVRMSSSVGIKKNGQWDSMGVMNNACIISSI